MVGKIELNVTFSEGNSQRTELITFDVVDINYSYNAIFGRNTIIKFAVVIHQAYLCMKMPTVGGIIMILGNQEEAQRCEDNATCATKNFHAIKAANAEEEEEEPKFSKLDQAYKPEGVMPGEHMKNCCLAKTTLIVQ